MKRIVWSRTARRELEALNDWLAEQDADLPLILTMRVEVELSRLLDHPQVGTVVPDSSSRQWRMRRTPYLIFFRPTREGIRILKVRHAKFDWKR